MSNRTFFWLLVLIVLWFVPGYAKQYFDYRREMARIEEQRAYYAEMKRIAEQSLENTKKTNAEFLRLTRQTLGLEKAI